ncbi:MAG: hypothetical protein EXS13_09250 [Planctomycetes bacterium]|nr:hypothetical protein [Planctomycetota bacterium]
MTAHAALVRAAFAVVIGLAVSSRAHAQDPASGAGHPKPPSPDQRDDANRWPPFHVVPATVHEPASQGPPKSVADGDWVIGVEIGGVARA